MQETIRRLAAEKFEAAEIDVFLGYGVSEFSGQTRPLAVTSAAECENLVWNENCGQNLAAYLPRYVGKRVGILVRPHDARTLITLIQEKQIDRDKVWIVGIEYTGGGPEAQRPGVPALAAPPMSDVTVQVGPLPPAKREAAMAAFLRLPAEERHAAFEREMAKCIRCYACRNACPLCYCAECFAEKTMPEWVSPGNNSADAAMFHVGRLMHAAGRCGECGACANACPMGIPLDAMARGLAEFVEKEYGTKAGMDPAKPGAMGAFDPQDNNGIFL